MRVRGISQPCSVKLSTAPDDRIGNDEPSYSTGILPEDRRDLRLRNTGILDMKWRDVQVLDVKVKLNVAGWEWMRSGVLF